MSSLPPDTSKVNPVPEYLRQDHPPHGGEEVGPEDIWVPPLDKYVEALRSLPSSGGGGCHAALLSVANYGRAAGLTEDRIFRDLRARVHGTRKVSDREIQDAIRKALSTTSFVPRHPQIVVDGQRAFERICERGRQFDIPLLAELSPVIVDWLPRDDPAQLLKLLYSPNDLLFIGKKYDACRQDIRPAAEWIHRFERGAYVPPHIIPNPLSGVLGTRQDGKPSYRSDNCVKKFKFVTLEFDKKTIEQQIQFYGGVRLPIVALIHSGSKSVHAWIRADVSTAEEWNQKIEIELFDLLRPMGIDGTSRNESRLSRTPGHYRQEKKQWQRILYLNPAGAALQP